MTKEEHQRLIEQAAKYQQMTGELGTDRVGRDDESDSDVEESKRLGNENSRDMISEQSLRKENESDNLGLDGKDGSLNQQNKELNDRDTAADKPPIHHMPKDRPSVPKMPKSGKNKRGSNQTSKPAFDSSKAQNASRRKTYAGHSIESDIMRQKVLQQKTTTENEDVKSQKNWTSKCEQLEEKVGQILIAESHDQSEKSKQKRALLEKLLAYAASESRSARSGSDVNDLSKTFNIPQYLLDELEELGFDIMKILNDIIEQYSYLFTKRKRNKAMKHI
jgi:hypothetical protein